jgi:hypothetical protein
MELENTPDVEVETPETEEATEEVAEAEEAAEQDSPEADSEEVPAEATEPLILGKYKSQEELEKAYLNAQKELTKTKQAQADPNYVYELAKKAGLTDAEAQAEAQVDINTLVDQTVQQRLEVAKDYDKALSILPELGTDAKLEAWASGLFERGMTHEQAAQTIKDTLAAAGESARVAGAKSKEVEISEKEAAQTAPTIGNVDSDALETENLLRASKSLNRVEQDNALEALIMKNL